MNQQKRLFAEQVRAFVDDSTSSPYTDISGGLLQAVEYPAGRGLEYVLRPDHPGPTPRPDPIEIDEDTTRTATS